MGFVRRFDSIPNIDVLSEIEGPVIIDSTIAGTPRGAETGVACLIGEFADMTYACAVSANGVVTTSPQPVEVTAADFESKVGGFDETIGNFGGDMGNGYVDVKSTTWSRLVLVAVNLACSQGARMYRELPTNKSATDPSPAVGVSGVTVPAGTEFRTSGGARVKLAQAVTFAGDAEYTRGVDGAVTAAGSAAFGNFDAAGGNFLALVRDDGLVGAQIGDVLVLGVVGGAGAQGSNAGTYRVRAVTDADTLVVEKMDGSAFTWVTGTALAWRLYAGDVADTGGTNHVGTQAGYRVLARTLDSTVAVDTTLTPTVVADPATPTATTWAPLTGLKMRSAPTTGLVHTAAVQGANAANASGLDTLYLAAIDAVHEDKDPTSDVSIIWTARESTAIRSGLKAFTAKRKAQARGVVAHYAPSLSVVSKDTILTDAYPGVGGVRAREGILNWPGVRVYVRAAVGKRLLCADGSYTTDGILDVRSAAWCASIESSLPPERNPGEESTRVQEILAPWIGLQRGVSGLDVEWYKRAKAKGITAPRIARGLDGQPRRCFQSGVTTSLTDGETTINERRFSFWAQDTAAQIVDPFTKSQLTPKLEGDLIARLAAWADQLIADQRIAGRRIVAGRGAGNTEALRQRGIFLFILELDMISDLRVAVINARVAIGATAATSTFDVTFRAAA
mgnify:CR=1 FL=1